MRNTLRQFALVIAAFLAAVTMFNPNPASAHGTDPTLAAQGRDLVRLDERVARAERTLRELRDRKVACAEVSDAVCTKAMETAIDKAMKDLRSEMEKARTTCKVGDAHACATALTELKNATEKAQRMTDRRLERIERYPRPFVGVNLALGSQIRIPMSAYGVTGSSFTPGITIMGGLEPHAYGVSFLGSWESVLFSGLDGNRWAGELVLYDRQLTKWPKAFKKHWAFGCGLGLATTRLLDDQYDVRYASTGPTASVMLMRRSGESNKATGDDGWVDLEKDLHFQFSIELAAAYPQVFAYSQDFGRMPEFLVRVNLGPVLGGRPGSVD